MKIFKLLNCYFFETPWGARTPRLGTTALQHTGQTHNIVQCWIAYCEYVVHPHVLTEKGTQANCFADIKQKFCQIVFFCFVSYRRGTGDKRDTRILSKRQG